MNFNNIPLVMTPFADGDSAKDYSFLESGITHQMTVPTENGGARFTRHQMNGVGYLATLGAYLDRVGYPYGKERLDPSTFGGYPKGAILITEDDGLVREYISLVDNNTHPLPKESADGTYVGDEWWAPTIPTESASFFPNFSEAALHATMTIGPINYGKPASGTCNISETGWYSIERKFSTSNYDYSTNPDFGVLHNILELSGCEMNISLQGDGITNGAWVLVEPLNGLLGANASCLIPMSQGQQLRFDCSYTNYSRDAVNIYCHVKIRKIGAVELQ